MNQVKILLGIVIIIGALLLGVGIYLAFNSSNQPNTANIPATPNPTKAKFQPKKTIPSSSMMSDGNGFYYENPDNTLESGVAYKYQGSNRVYIYDGEFLRPVANEEAYFKFYGCSGKMRVIDCAPVYLIKDKKPIGDTIQ